MTNLYNARHYQTAAIAFLVALPAMVVLALAGQRKE